MQFPVRELLAAAVLIAARSDLRAATLTQADFFDDSVLHEIQIRINPLDWQTLKANFRENTYYPCILEWRGMVVENIAIRSRGRGSRSGIKPNLRVDINRYEETQHFLGLKAFHLKANNEDASFLRERLTMQFFRRMGWPASRETHTRLYVNGQYAGLYLIVEEINKDFLTRNLAETEGYLYEWKPPDEPYHFEYRGPDLSGYSPVPFDPKTHENAPDPRPLEAMIRTINQSSDADFPRAASEYLDLKLFATYLGIETYLLEFDGILGYAVGMNNFHFYRFNGRNLSLFIPWDKDLTFLSPERDIWNNMNANMLTRRALPLPEVRDSYLRALLKSAALAGGPDGWLEREATRQYEQIRAAAREDPFKLYMDAGIRRPSSEEVFQSAVAQVLEIARERNAVVLRQVRASGFRPPEGSPRLSEGGIVSAATGSPANLAAGSVAVVYGERLSDTAALADGSPLPTTLAGVSVLINGFAAPLLFVSPTQINLLIPWEIRSGNVPVTVIVNGALSNSLSVDITGLPAFARP